MMLAPATIFFDFNLPNGTTWFYFSFLLSMALFFKFGRVLSVRNWDVVTLFLLVPGFLLLQEARPNSANPKKSPALAVASLVAGSSSPTSLEPVMSLGVFAETSSPWLGSSRLLWFGYLWLLCGSGYLLIRCLLDLALVSRPALAPNLSFGGLAWLAGALFVCLIAVAYRPERLPGQRETFPSTAMSELPKQSVPVGRETIAFERAHQTLGFWLSHTFAVLCHLAVVLGIIFIGSRHFQDAAGGMAAATFYLMLPYTGLYVGQAHHVWPAALVVWALVVYRMPALAGLLLGLAAVTTYFPALVFPAWLSFYWKRGAGRFLAAFVLTACVGLAIVGGILWWSDELAGIIREGMNLSAWQPWRVPSSEGFWTGVHWAYRIPIFIAYLAFVITTACWPVPKNLAHLIALSAAVFIGVQFWYADQGGVYVLWYLPLLVLLVFRPNLSERRPLPIQPETDWLCRMRRACSRFFGRLVKAPEPPVQAQ
jgi:hypothetical protein